MAERAPAKRHDGISNFGDMDKFEKVRRFDRTGQKTSTSVRWGLGHDRNWRSWMAMYKNIDHRVDTIIIKRPLHCGGELAGDTHAHNTSTHTPTHVTHFPNLMWGISSGTGNAGPWETPSFLITTIRAMAMSRCIQCVRVWGGSCGVEAMLRSVVSSCVCLCALCWETFQPAKMKNRTECACDWILDVGS